MAIKNFKRASRFLIALFATLALCMPVAFATSSELPIDTASKPNFISRWFQAAKRSLSAAPKHVNSRGRLLLALSTAMGTYWLSEKYGFTEWVMSFFSKEKPEEKKSEGEGEGSWDWKKKATVGLLVAVLLVGIAYFIRNSSSKEEEEEEATDPEIEK